MSKGIDYMKAERVARAEDRRLASDFARARAGDKACPFVGCGATFPNVFRLIDHIEDVHKPAFDATRSADTDEVQGLHGPAGHEVSQ